MEPLFSSQSSQNSYIEELEFEDDFANGKFLLLYFTEICSKPLVNSGM